jgi:hypothetical protein
MALTNAVRNANKKLRNFETKNPGVHNERYKELLRGVIKAKVAVAKAEQREAKKEASLKVKNLTDDEVLDAAFQQNAKKNAKNAENKRLEKIRLAEAKKQDEDKKEFYDKVLQPAMAKHIIMSIVESSEGN